MDKIPTTAEWVTIIEAIGDQYVRVEWINVLGGCLTGLSILIAIGSLITLMLFLGKKFGAFN